MIYSKYSNRAVYHQCINLTKWYIKINDVHVCTSAVRYRACCKCPTSFYHPVDIVAINIVLPAAVADDHIAPWLKSGGSKQLNKGRN